MIGLMSRVVAKSKLEARQANMADVEGEGM